MNFADLADVEQLVRLDQPLAARTPRFRRKQTGNAPSCASVHSTPGKAIARGVPNGGKTPKGDRFIPSRGVMDINKSNVNLTKENAGDDQSGTSNTAASMMSDDASSKILTFKGKAPAPPEGHQNSLHVLYSQSKGTAAQQQSTKKRCTRHIPQAPDRILDAPDLVNDYYLNLLDWSAGNVLAVALAQTLYLWDASSGSITQLVELGEGDYVTSVRWLAGSDSVGGGSDATAPYLAVGTASASVQLWDVRAQKQLREMRGHEARVSALSWRSHVLTSGSRDSTVRHWDVRVQHPMVGVWRGHSQEVCGLRWAPSQTQLATGGNDNLLNIWDARSIGSDQQPSVAPMMRLTEHQAAVRAVAWCPWQSSLLASGAGTACRTLKMWNTSGATTGGSIQSVDTESQVCAIEWSRNYKELVTAQGFSRNQITLWKYPTLEKRAELEGHT